MNSPSTLIGVRRKESEDLRLFSSSNHCNNTRDPETFSTFILHIHLIDSILRARQRSPSSVAAAGAVDGPARKKNQSKEAP